MQTNQPKRAKVIAVVLQIEGGGKTIAFLSENEQKLLTGAMVGVVGGDILKLSKPVNGQIQTRGA